MLEVKKLNFRHLLKDFSFSFLPGRIYGITGHNGAGKSTLLKNLAFIWKPSSGLVLWQGSPLNSKPRAEVSRIASYLPQTLQLPFPFTVEEFISMGRYLHPSLTCIDPFLEQLNLREMRKKNVQQLSQGEKQRVFMARTIATEAPLLLLDEPTAHLDPEQQHLLWSLLSRLAKEGKTLLVATHDLTHTSRYCHQTLCLAHGRLTETVTQDYGQNVR